MKVTQIEEFIAARINIFLVVTIMFSLAGFLAYAEEAPQTSEELLQFNLYRKMIENRLKVLGDDAVQRFEPFVLWMRQVIAEKAPELLDDAPPSNKNDQSSEMA